MLGYLKRGETYRRHGDLAAAVRDLRKASVLDRTATRPLEQLGDVHFAQGQFARAADRYQAYLRLDDRSPRVLYKRALALYADGNAAAAVPPLRQAVHLNDRFAEGYYLLGVCLRAQRQQPEALWALQRAVRLAPGLMPARETLADLFDDLNRQSDRIEQLEALAALEPDRTDRYVALAMARAETGRTNMAALVLGRAAERRPDDMRVYTALATVWLRIAEEQDDPAALARALDATRTILGARRTHARRPAAARPRAPPVGRRGGSAAGAARGHGPTAGGPARVGDARHRGRARGHGCRRRRMRSNGCGHSRAMNAPRRRSAHASPRSRSA